MKRNNNNDLLAWLAIGFIGMLIAAVGAFAQPSAATLTPAVPKSEQPVAPVREVVDDYFGTKITDPYRWMETPKNGELDRWMKEQNEYTRSILDKSPVRNDILSSIDKLTNTNVAVTSVKKVGHLFFYLKIAPGEADRKLYFRYGPGGMERLLVDPAKVSEDGKRYSIISFSPSPDGRYVSYLISPGGAELGEIRVLETATARDTGDRIPGARWEAGSWLPDNISFLYVRFPQSSAEAKATEHFQNRRVFLHKLGDSLAKDRAIFGHDVNKSVQVDPKLLPFPYVPVGSKFAFILVNTGVSPNSEIYSVAFEELNQPEIPWRKIVDLKDEVSGLALGGDDLYLLTYKNAPRFKVIKTSLQKPDLENPATVIPQSEAVLTGITATSDAVIVQRNDGGISRLQSADLKTGKVKELKLPFEGTISAISANRRDSELIFATESWIKSSTIFSYDSKKEKFTDTKLQPASPIDTSVFESVQVKVRARDGVTIPLSIIHKKGIKRDGQNPVAMSGYGSYGISQNPFFMPGFFAWLERGGIVVFAHVRGGGEYGREWHLAGFRKNKPNTWRDFIDCAEYLIAEKLTSAGLIAGHGASAGGILVGNAIAERPDLFGAAVIQVGLNNMLRYETTANGVPNTAEFGSVKTEEGFKTLLEMDAYHKIKEGVKYPAVILTHGINDPRVEPWFSAKLAARLQAASASDRRVLLRIDYDAGHGIGSSRAQRNEEMADVFTFLFEEINNKGGKKNDTETLSGN